MSKMGVFGCKMFKSRCKQAVQGFIIAGRVFKSRKLRLPKSTRYSPTPMSGALGRISSNAVLVAFSCGHGHKESGRM